MRTFNTSLIATFFVSCTAFAGTSGEESYSMPQSLDSIGSLFQDTNSEGEAFNAANAANCEARFEALKARMAGLNYLLKHTDIQLAYTTSSRAVVNEESYVKALGTIELRLRTASAERHQLKYALAEYRELLDNHKKNSQHESQYEAVFDDISSVLWQVEASFAEQR